MDVDRGCTWQIKVHRSAAPFMTALKQNEPEAFADMIASVKLLAQETNLYEVNRKPNGLNLQRSYPTGWDIGLLRFKRAGAKWRCILSVVRDGMRIKADELTCPGDGSVLQIVYCDTRHESTYGRLFKDFVSLL